MAGLLAGLATWVPAPWGVPAIGGSADAAPPRAPRHHALHSGRGTDDAAAAARRAVEQARLARQALIARQQRQASDLAARTQARNAAQAQARQDTARAAALSAATVDATAQLQHSPLL